MSKNLELVATLGNGGLDKPLDFKNLPPGTKVFIQKPKTYEIVLSENEAVLLKALLSMVNMKGGGKTLYDLYNKLQQKGVEDHPDIDLSGNGKTTGYGILGPDTHRGGIEFTLPAA